MPVYGDGEGGWDSTDRIVEIFNLPGYSIPVTLVHIYKTELPTAHLEPDDLNSCSDVFSQFITTSLALETRFTDQGI